MNKRNLSDGASIYEAPVCKEVRLESEGSIMTQSTGVVKINDWYDDVDDEINF